MFSDEELVMKFSLAWILLVGLLVEQLFYLFKSDYPYRYGIPIKKIRISNNDMDSFINRMRFHTGVYRHANGSDVFISYKYPLFALGIQLLVGQAIFGKRSELVIRVGWFMASFIIYIIYSVLRTVSSNPLVSIVCSIWLCLFIWYFVTNFLKQVNKGLNG